jgi:hypothetical protein
MTSSTTDHQDEGQRRVDVWPMKHRDVLRDPVERDRLAEHLGAGDDQQDRDGGRHALEGASRKPFQVSVPQDHAVISKSGGKADGGGLGRRGRAGIDHADHDDSQHHGRAARAMRRANTLGPARGRLGLRNRRKRA